LGENEVCNSAFGIIVAPVVLRIPVGVFEGIVDRGVEEVLDALGPGNFIGSNTIEKLVFLPEREAISIDPSTPCSMERSVQVLLVVLATLDQRDIRQFSEALCSFGLNATGEHADGIAATLRKGWYKL